MTAMTHDDRRNTFVAVLILALFLWLLVKMILWIGWATR